jgi:transcriptional regulator with XRE-family HTH domain
MNFGDRLRAARVKKGLTQEGLGKGLGTDGKDASKSVVYGWEKGPHHPRVDQLMLICDRLGCSADYLLFGLVRATELSPDAAQIAKEIDAFENEERRYVLNLCKESIKFVRRRQNGSGSAPTNEQMIAKKTTGKRKG